ncbi:peptidoglycan-binding protein [Georgenia thermotolerans]|uniref:Peptidoglycan-binding protein n=1 Tax=Georgenia thermotolerans TaxID=527326 RepID=A0A7J5URZ8_9MICO|nr:peptidoglycan-binding protein [Georgenia thermotolerans]KAE8765011.1 peptidoglycan-binding protein [Georgenia thermotolerans]
MNDEELTPLSEGELAAEAGAALPDKEVISLLDLNADLDLGLDAAAPIDLAVAANANVAAPIDAAVGANVLSSGSEAQALADQGVIIDQGITGEAVAEGVQDSTIDQAADGTGGDATDGSDGATDDTGTTTPSDTEATDPTDTGSVLDGDLLDVDVDLAADLDLAAPIGGAVAANANVAAPIDAAVAANVGSVDSDATAIAQQDAIITQDIDADAEATIDQSSQIEQ